VPASHPSVQTPALPKERKKLNRRPTQLEKYIKIYTPLKISYILLLKFSY
jgi:hypothetical protein